MTQRKHSGLRSDGKLKKGYRYSGKRNKNGSAKIVKVKTKYQRGGEGFKFTKKCDKNGNNES